MEELKGYVERIIYSNGNNGYIVFELNSDTEDITCVGYLHTLDEGENVILKGEYVSHPTYGKQFSVTSYEVVVSSDETAIRRYLGSGAVKGIGTALAGRIVDMFGEDTFRVMEEEPELLARVKGISMRKAQEIASQVMEKQELRKTMIFLQQFGITNNLAMKIYAKYGQDTYSVMQENPYKLAEEIDGVGFKMADSIAFKAGIPIDSDYRIRSGILYVLSRGVGEGHVYLPRDILVRNSSMILEVDLEPIEIQLQNLAVEKKVRINVIGEEVRVYLSVFFNMERNVAGMLRKLDVLVEEDADGVRQQIRALDLSDETTMDELQLNAVVSAVCNGVSIITGGPGTGKTTTINRLLQYFEIQGEEFLLAAPTGRAAKRMTEATGYEAFTVQRLLGVVPIGNETGFKYDRNELNPFEVDAIIVDEMSMVDINVFHALLKAIVPGTRLIMVGDTNQLPSVGPGSVLKDIIASELFATVRLERIFRQDEESDIITNAHMINAGKHPDLHKKSNDFFFMQRDDVNVILKIIVTLVTEKLPKYVNAKSYDIQVMTPMRKGPLGVESLNPILQKYINPPSLSKNEREHGRMIFREGDKVMQIRNNYQLEWEIRGKYDIVVDKGLGIFNGDMGYILSINADSETLEVVYEENHIVRYPFSMLDELELAYAVTIHKSQGSEYPAVIIPIMTGPRPLMNRNLLYTGVTRARRCVVLLGDEEQINAMIDNTEEQKRYTGLKDMLRMSMEECEW